MVVVGVIGVRDGVVTLGSPPLLPLALAEGPPREDPKEANEHDGGQEGGGEQAIPHAEAEEVGQEDVEPGADDAGGAGAAAPGGEAQAAVVVGQAEEAELAGAAGEARERDPGHLGGDGPVGGRERDQEHARRGPGGEDEDPQVVGHAVDEVGRDQLREEGREHVRQEDHALGHVGAHEVLGRGEDDHVEDVVDEAFWWWGWWWMIARLVQNLEARRYVV